MTQNLRQSSKIKINTIKLTQNTLLIEEKNTLKVMFPICPRTITPKKGQKDLICSVCQEHSCTAIRVRVYVCEHICAGNFDLKKHIPIFDSFQLSCKKRVLV